MKESELEIKFCSIVREAGGKAYKFVSPGNAGVPDRIVVLPGGKVGFVELKRPGEEPRKLQRLRLEELRKLGCHAAVVDSAEDAAAFVSQVRRQEPAQDRDSRLFEEMVNRSPSGRRRP
ncbi:VRR-NUC domain-containing protein [Lachnospiraceae bacterium 38-10]